MNFCEKKQKHEKEKIISFLQLKLRVTVQMKLNFRLRFKLENYIFFYDYYKNIINITVIKVNLILKKSL